MVEIRAVLPAETGCRAAHCPDLALGRDGTSPPTSTALPSSTEPVAIAERCAEITAEATSEQRRADALHDIARTYLAAEPDDRSGEDRHLVVVQVSAESLVEDVPAGTLPRCGVVGGGPSSPAPPTRLHREGLARHLRRPPRSSTSDAPGASPPGPSVAPCGSATGTCVFLRSRHQSKHLDAHHLTPWSEGGPTDLDEPRRCVGATTMVHEAGCGWSIAGPRPRAAGLSRQRPGSLAPSAVSSAAASMGVTAASAGLDAALPGARRGRSPGPGTMARDAERLILRPDVPTDDTAPCTEGGAGAAAADEAEGDGPVGEDHPRRLAEPRHARRPRPRTDRRHHGRGGLLPSPDCVQALCESVLVRAA